MKQHLPAGCRRLRFICICFALLGCAAGASWGQAYPERPI